MQDHKLSDLQLSIMRALWGRKEATVVEVHESLLAERGLAPTTVATVLSRLEKRGLVDHRSEGRQFIYRATVTEEDVRSSMVGEITDLLFRGDVGQLVSHLINGREISSGDLARVKALIEAKENEAGDKDEPS